uniref:Uncharacterized protein n=1 Tax=Kalanchoe fedtschenkoi TaxID=63787 RepID=A0A7N0RHE0_KALFE
MNPPAPEQPLQPPRLSATCDRHPEEHFAGSFCPLCLCERLATLDISSSPPAPSVKKPSSNNAAASAIRSIFKPAPPIRFFPELRRAKSFSASKGEGFSGVFEPQRRSCDVRGRSNLWTLFTQDDDKKADVSVPVPAAAGGAASNQDEIQVDEIVPEEEVVAVIPELAAEVAREVKTIKDHIDLDSSHNKKPPGRDLKDFAGSFWSAASVFSKKLQKWRRKQKMKKRSNGSGSATLPVEKPIGRQFRETQSEVADYGFGRRSCDTDPRFSLDIGRISLDDSRYSFDEPRASWDGYLIGKTLPRQPPMLAVAEDPPPVARIDAHIPVEEAPPHVAVANGDETLPGGSAQTRDYYSDTSSRRRKSFERSNSLRKTAASVVAEIEEMKSVSNSKVSPTNADYANGPKLVMGDRELRDLSLNSNSLREFCSDTFDASFRDAGVNKGSIKKSRRWIKAFNIWGLIHWRSANKDDEEERFSRVNGVERSYSESWQDLRGGKRNGDELGGFSRKIMRSNSSVSWRSSYSMDAAGFGSGRRIGVDMNGHGHSSSKKKKKKEFVLERNQSAKFSPNNNGDRSLFKFYLPPLSGSRRGGFGNAKPNNPHTTTTFARSGSRVF